MRMAMRSMLVQLLQEEDEDVYNHAFYPACPCPHRMSRRFLQDAADSDADDDAAVWEIVYTSFVLLGMFAALVSDQFGADSVMMCALTAFMAAEIISIPEGLSGFANEGLVTVLVLFVVAEGISKTGALDWYMNKLLGHPTSVASAQMRLMVPIAVVSAFLNNTPVVVVMIPIVQKWAKNINVSAQQLLIPLSFASILGGTCTLIGTSTNLVVQGLLRERYPNDPDVTIGLFDLGEYGIPLAISGMIYILLAAPFLLPGGPRNKGSSDDREVVDDSLVDVLLGARLTQWSPAAGRTVQRSGLRDTGGIYLVSVHRAVTGNVHRAVSNDFVLNVGDILYFTGLVESFGEFAAEHGLEVVTNEVEHQQDNNVVNPTAAVTNTEDPNDNNKEANVFAAEDPQDTPMEALVPQLLADHGLHTVEEMKDFPMVEIGITKESLLAADEEERLRTIHRLTDEIRTSQQSPSLDHPAATRPRRRPERANEPAKIVVTVDHELVVIGIDAQDRTGLLLDISKGLLRLHLQLHHTEAAVVAERSLSIWRCESSGADLPDLEEIWSVLNALLSSEGGVQAMKQRGLRVIRARVTKGSRLIQKTVAEVDFRQVYKAAIVATQRKVTTSLSTTRLEEGDVLVLQASDDSALLKRPPEDFYKNLNASMAGSQRSSVKSLVNMVSSRLRSGSRDGPEEMEIDFRKNSSADISRRNSADNSDDDFFVGDGIDMEEGFAGGVEEETPDVVAHAVAGELELEQEQAVWRDLQVVFHDQQEGDDENENAGGGGGAREFLTAMQIAKKSQFAGKTVSQAGISKLPDLFLVSIDRPVVVGDDDKKKRRASANNNETMSLGEGSGLDTSMRTDNQIFLAIAQDEVLKEGDVLWFAGPPSAVGDLRKIPGLVSYVNDEVAKMNDSVFDRRLIQAVIARNGPLVGKTIKEVRFRTRYGAAVIAVHREGKRVHEHPGQIRLHAGDVLLLEGGPSFIAKTAENGRSFALLAEVEDSAPPRLSLLIPALILTAGMLIVYTAEWTSLLISALVAAILMVAFGILSEQEVRDAVNWEVFLTIASAFGIGLALVNSGVADAIANFLVEIGTGIGIGDAGLLGAVYFATFLISNVVTNNAAAALIFPVAMNAAEQTGVDRRIMSFSVMLGASASFMSPFGYTTNLLIYGPGGYKYNDFVIFGTPMQILLWILSTVFLSVLKPWYVSWIASVVVLVIVILGRSMIAAFAGSDAKPVDAQKQESAMESAAEQEAES